jgi:hypothetical protein
MAEVGADPAYGDTNVVHVETQDGERIQAGGGGLIDRGKIAGKGPIYELIRHIPQRKDQC